jgi:hypothetical protein
LAHGLEHKERFMTSGVASSRDSLLRMAIHLDATGTGLLGLGTAAFAHPLAELTGLTPVQAYVAAAAFVFYGVFGNLLARRPRIRGIGLGLSAFNFFGTVAALATVASGVLPLTGPGKAIVLGCGIYTLFFGAMQLVGVRRLR